MQTFDPIAFKLEYPQFNNISDIKLTNMFNYEASTLGAPVTNSFTIDEQKYYWQCVVLCHILQIEEMGLTGTPNSFSQGTDGGGLSVDLPQWANWWGQTPYGQRCYQIIQTYQAGGHVISNGEMPYMGDAMSGWSTIYGIGGY